MKSLFIWCYDMCALYLSYFSRGSCVGFYKLDPIKTEHRINIWGERRRNKNAVQSQVNLLLGDLHYDPDLYYDGVWLK